MHFQKNYFAEKTRFYAETFHTSIGFDISSEGDECDFDGYGTSDKNTLSDYRKRGHSFKASFL